MTTLNQLNTQIRNRLDKEFRNKQFTREDFHDIADALNKPRKNISSCLHKFEKEYGLLEIVASEPTGHGGGSIKTYKVVKGASFEIKNSGIRKKEACEKIKLQAARKAQCFRRLDRVVAGWVGV